MAEPVASVVSTLPPPAHPPHALDGPKRWAWLYPLEEPTPDLVAEMLAHGITGVVPQQGTGAIAWARRHAPALARAGLETCIGLGRITADAIVEALDVPGVPGTMLDEEEMTDAARSRAICADVLRRRPDAARRVVDCYYPCADRTEGGAPTGHGAIARAYADLCGMRACQDYWEPRRGHPKDVAPLGFVRARLDWSAKQYAAIDPGDPVRLSGQLYRRRAADHVATLWQERARAVFVWCWREADEPARAALRVLHDATRPAFAARYAERSDVEAEALAAWAQGALNALVWRAGDGTPDVPALAVDGAWGARSAAAQRAYATRRGIPATGACDDETLMALSRGVLGA